MRMKPMLANQTGVYLRLCQVRSIFYKYTDKTISCLILAKFDRVGWILLSGWDCFSTFASTPVRFHRRCFMHYERFRRYRF